jgi:hypothetical protein
MNTILLTGDAKFFDKCYDKNHDIYKIVDYVKELLNIDGCVFLTPEDTVHPTKIEAYISQIMLKNSTFNVILTFSDNVLNASRLINCENSKENLVIHHVQHNYRYDTDGAEEVLKFEFSCITGDLTDPEGWNVMKQFSMIEDLLGKLAKFRRAKKE